MEMHWIILICWVGVGVVTGVVAYLDGQFEKTEKSPHIPLLAGLALCGVFGPLAVALTVGDIIKNRKARREAAAAAARDGALAAGVANPFPDPQPGTKTKGVRMKSKVVSFLLGVIVMCLSSLIPWDRLNSWLYPPPPPPSALLQQLDKLLNTPDIWKFKKYDSPLQGGASLETEGVKIHNVDDRDRFAVSIGGQDVTMLFQGDEAIHVLGKARETIRTILAERVMPYIPAPEEMVKVK